MRRTRVIILGAAGRDFHNFHVVFRRDPAYEVVAFTATQIPTIENRRYPAALAGDLYPEGIPIYPEERLADLVARERIDLVVFSYSDVTHEHVMHRASLANAGGADFMLLGARRTMLKAKVPVVSICAVRTGAGKSQTTRRVAEILRTRGLRVVVVRHPMPYGNLAEQRVQRFATMADLDCHHCTIEEREEYEPHLSRGTIVYAGVDYGAILEDAEAEADVLLWDGGNNDIPFFEPDLEMVVADPHRAGHGLKYYPGEVNLRRAGVVVINKVDTAPVGGVDEVRATVRQINPSAIIIEAASPIAVEGYQRITGRRVLVVEDGPTLTHGEMQYGAGIVAARTFGAAAIVDPRPYVVGTIAETFRLYPTIGPLLPAMGYSDEQIADLQATIDRTECELVISATPVDLGRLVRVNKPVLRVRYELQEIGKPDLEDVLRDLGRRARDVSPRVLEAVS